MEIQKTAKISDNNKEMIENMFKVGAHFAYSKSRRHPSAKQYIFGVKNRVEIFDLEKTQELLEKAKEFVKSVAATGKQILFVGGKSESKEVIKKAAESIGMPYVSGRWIGGTFTNFPEIRKRIEKMERMAAAKEKGELTKYTKKERLLMDREAAKLDLFFGGLVSMKNLPAAVFLIDQKRENIAVKEADQMGIPVISLSGSDCDFREVAYPIPANDASVASIAYFVNEIVSAYIQGKKINQPLKQN
jgi:small subunit ribosomal protein S2